MKIIKDVDQFKGGWFVGAFTPTAYNTTAVEVSYKTHYKDEIWPAHYHLLSDEINYLIQGEMEINGELLSAPCVFIIYKGETAAPKFFTDVKVIVVKIPGILNDKYEVKEINQ